MRTKQRKQIYLDADTTEYLSSLPASWLESVDNIHSKRNQTRGGETQGFV